MSIEYNCVNLKLQSVSILSMYFYIIQYHITEFLLNILRILYLYEEEVDFSFTITKNLRGKKSELD